MITKNRKAYFEFSILEEFDAGIILTGNEVKSIRMGNVTIGDSFAYMKAGEVWIKNMKVAPYKQAHKLDKHDENRDKKLLLNRKELNKIDKLLQDKGTTIVPLSIFIKRFVLDPTPLTPCYGPHPLIFNSFLNLDFSDI